MLDPSSVRPFTGAAAAVGLILFAAACDGPEPLQPEVAPSFSRSVHAETAGDALLKAVRQATSRFHSTTQALEAGYEPDAHCVEVPGLGGMGHHWANESLVDPSFDPQEPEVLLYAPGPSGRLRLVAVEYVVIDVGQGQPWFGDQPFDVDGVPPLEAAEVDHWSLHVWLYEENPTGPFSPFNPRVSCT